MQDDEIMMLRKYSLCYCNAESPPADATVSDRC